MKCSWLFTVVICLYQELKTARQQQTKRRQLNVLYLILQISEILCHLQQPRPVLVQVSSQQSLAHRWCHILEPHQAQVRGLQMLWFLIKINNHLSRSSVVVVCDTVWRFQLKCVWNDGRLVSGSCCQTLEDEMISDSSWRRNSAVGYFIRFYLQR